MKIKVSNPESQAHLLRDAIKAAKLHDIQPYNKLHGNVVVRVLNEFEVEASTKHNQKFSDDLRVTKLVSAAEAHDMILAWLESPTKLIAFTDVTDVNALEPFLESHTLLHSISGDALVVMKPIDIEEDTTSES